MAEMDDWGGIKVRPLDLPPAPPPMPTTMPTSGPAD
jgi:hypothetical protein